MLEKYKKLRPLAQLAARGPDPLSCLWA